MGKLWEAPCSAYNFSNKNYRKFHKAENAYKFQ